MDIIETKIDNKTIEKLQYDLVRDNLLDFEDLERAREISKVQNTNLGQALINSSLISEEKLMKFFEEKLHLPFVDLETYSIDRECLNFISYKEAFKHKILPLFLIEDTLTIAMADPLDLFAIDDIIARTGKKIEPVISSEKIIIKKINEYYEIKDKIEDIKTELQDDSFHWLDILHKDNLSEEHIQDLVQAILKYTIKENAGELFFEQTPEGLSVNIKQNGTNIISTGTIPSLLINPFISKLKTISSLDPMVNEMPQLGKFSFNVNNQELIAGISAFPTINGERISLKIYHPPKSLRDLNFSIQQIKLIEEAINTPGVILSCGSSMSGKTHVIYSILSELTGKNKNAMTIESIAKYKLKNVNQCELNENVGFNLNKAMRFIEFQEPDIIYFEGVSTKEGLDFFTSLTMKNKTLLTEFLAENIDDLRRKFSHNEFSLFKSALTCLIFIHSQDKVEVFNKEELDKYLF